MTDQSGGVGRRPRFPALPRLDSARGPAVGLDPMLGALVLWVTPHPLLHGCLGVFRSLGRQGIAVTAVTARTGAPVARSRYVRAQIAWDRREGDGALIDRLVDHGKRTRQRALVVCTADDMAVLAARNRTALEPWFVLPEVPPELPAQLSDKQALHDLCRTHDVATPESTTVMTEDDLERAAAELSFPLAVKSGALRDQVVAQSVANTVVARSPEELKGLARSWTAPYETILQEYLPDERCEDWIVHGYIGTDGTPKIVFTGRKTRSWPPGRGATSAAFVSDNPELAAEATRFCHVVGYRGVFDTDWRLDRRDGRYHLLDFNPRVGAQFRMFEDDTGLDVVRAMHLDLSGRAVHRGRQRNGERFLVEPWDLASRFVDRSGRGIGGGSGRPRLAWSATDDPLPVLGMVARQLRQSLALRLHRLIRRRGATRAKV